MPTNIVVPVMGESVVEATVLKWYKQEGDRVAAGDKLVELETEKVNLDVSSEHAGVLSRILRHEGEDVKVGDALGEIDQTVTPDVGARSTTAADLQPPTVPSQPEGAPARQDQEESTRNGGRITPVAERLAREYGIDPSRVPPGEAGGWITRDDVQALIEKNKGPMSATPSPGLASPPPAPPAPTPPEVLVPGRDRREERVRMTRRRQTIARRLVEAQHQAAMLTTFNEVDMGQVIELRSKHRERVMEQFGVKLGFTSFFVRAAIAALKAFPRLNAQVDDDEMLLKHYYDIGIAVGAAEGLVVPVIRDAERLSLIEIERAISDLVKKVEDGTLSLEDIRGGTFTITNGGVFGSLLSTPILNAPQVGILGLHKVGERPIARDGQVVIRPMMYMALSYDHRIVDGREAVQFLVQIKQLIEDPSALLLGG